nr:hypothetical protein [Tanacetum cinerariifolium]
MPHRRHSSAWRQASAGRASRDPDLIRKEARSLIRSYDTSSNERQKEIEIEWTAADRANRRMPTPVFVRFHTFLYHFIGSSPLAQTGMVDFMQGRAVIEAAQRKRVKYDAKCANIGYEFLPFSFSSLEELENDAVTLLKRVRMFPLT